MDELNLFDLVPITFDPLETGPNGIVTKITQECTELNKRLQRNDARRAEYQAQIEYLQACLDPARTSNALFEFKDGSPKKVTALYRQMGAEHLQKVANAAKASARVKWQVGQRSVTKPAVKTERTKFRLQAATLEEIYKEVGFQIIDGIDPLGAYPAFPIQSREIRDNLARLRSMVNPDPSGHTPSMCVDLYAFVAFLDSKRNQPAEQPAEYRAKKTTRDLHTVLDEWLMRNPTAGTTFIRLQKDIATAARSYVFDSDEHRKAYDLFLKYSSDPLQELFGNIRNASDQDKTSTRFAEQCIKLISAHFGDYQTSLAIYNTEAGIKEDPYIPTTANINVWCNICRSFSQFEDLNRAQSVNKCQSPGCGQNLYKDCNKCKGKVLAYLEQCPACQFVFANTDLFKKYFVAAEQALRDTNFDLARGSAVDALAADPGEAVLVKELRTRIEAAAAKYDKPINDLKILVAKRYYMAASSKLAQTLITYPQLNLTAFQTEIDAALSYAQSRFANLAPGKEADGCLEILVSCADFAPALRYLQANPPKPILPPAIVSNSQSGGVTIHWARTAEHGVTYRIVRKPGQDIPISEIDGDIVLDNSSDNSYQDNQILPGQYFSYAVFVCRYGVYSKGVGKTALLLSDVTNVAANQIGPVVHLTWEPPKNCIGVTIERTTNSETKTLLQNATGSFEDTNITFGSPYVYRLYANYNNLPRSQGVEAVITPTVPISAFSMRTEQVTETKHRVFWDIKVKGTVIRVIVNDRPVAETRSDTGFCEIGLAADSLHNIWVEASSGGKWVPSSNNVRVNTFRPCLIDRDASKLEEKPIYGRDDDAVRVDFTVKILGTIPSHVVGFYYALRTKARPADAVPWANEQEIGTAHDIRRISIEDYRTKGAIVVAGTTLDEATYYVSLFTIFKLDNIEVVSQVAKWPAKRLLSADLFWKVTKSMLGGGYRLSLEVRANRRLERIPALVLCACNEAHELLGPNDPKGTQIFETPEVNSATSRRNYKAEYRLDRTQSLKSQKLFLFEATPSDGGFRFRWATGFTGKA